MMLAITLDKKQQRIAKVIVCAVVFNCLHACVPNAHISKPIEMTGEPANPWLTNVTSFKLCHNQLTKLTANELIKRRCKTLDTAKFSALASAATYTEEFILWKGGKEGVLIDPQGKLLKITVSAYGGVFKLGGMSGIYRVAPEKHVQWYEMLNTAK